MCAVSFSFKKKKKNHWLKEYDENLFYHTQRAFAFVYNFGEVPDVCEHLEISFKVIDLEPVSLVVSPEERVAMVGRLLEELLTQLCLRMKR